MQVEQIYVYPIKSLRGVALPSATLDEHGFSYDRHFMLLHNEGDPAEPPDASKTKNMHVSRYPSMCLFSTDIRFPTKNDSTGGQVAVKFSDPQTRETKSLQVPLHPKVSGEEILVDMHQSKMNALLMDQSYHDWFSDCFGFNVLFIYLGSGHRPVLGNIAPNAATRNPRLRRELEASKASSWSSSITSMLSKASDAFAKAEDGYSITFADCASFLIVNRLSCDNVSEHLPVGEDMDITKFRPNIVISGAAEAFEEDYWAELSIGEADKDPLRMLLTQNCLRCVSLNVDYKSGDFGKGEAGQVLKTLQSYRRVDLGHPYSPAFGRYGFPARDDGRLPALVSVGDAVHVAKQNNERTVFRWPGLGKTKQDDLYPV